MQRRPSTWPARLQSRLNTALQHTTSHMQNVLDVHVGHRQLQTAAGSCHNFCYWMSFLA